MPLFEGKTPAERNKMIAAVVLPLLALVFVLRMLFFSSGPAPRQANSNRRPQTAAQRAQQASADAARAAEEEAFRAATPIVYERTVPSGGGGGRNIFAFSERPAGPPRVASTEGLLENLPTPPPTPPPPLVLAALSPQSRFARTGDFTMQVTGDKFTPETRVYIDGQEQPTQFRGPQQLTATVSGALLSSPGARTVVARTPDNLLYSNPTTLSVMQPPAPTVTYIGLLSRNRFDTAVLKEQDGNLLSVRKGDLIERGRFRVTEISERSVEVVDKDLDIRHVLPFVETRSTGGPAVGRGPVPGQIQMPQPMQPQSVQPQPPSPQPQKEEGDEEP